MLASSTGTDVLTGAENAPTPPTPSAARARKKYVWPAVPENACDVNAVPVSHGTHEPLAPSAYCTSKVAAPLADQETVNALVEETAPEYCGDETEQGSIVEPAAVTGARSVTRVRAARSVHALHAPPFRDLTRLVGVSIARHLSPLSKTSCAYGPAHDTPVLSRRREKAAGRALEECRSSRQT